MASGKDQIPVILTLMCDGLSLRKACAECGLSPNTFLSWVEADSELQASYSIARTRLLDAQAEELEEIGERAERAETAVEVAGLRLLSDNRKWLLSKLAPKKYGDKIAIGGADDLPAIQLQTTFSDDQLAMIAASAQKTGKSTAD